jgi:hypothetical protein
MPSAANMPIRSTIRTGEPTRPFRVIRFVSSPPASARRATSASSRPQTSRTTADRLSVAGSRPASAQSARSRPRCGPISAGGEVEVVLVGVPRGQTRCPAPAPAADDDGRAGRQPVVASGVRDRLAFRGVPQAGDNGELFLEAVEAFTEARERNAVRAVLQLVPARVEAECDPASAHPVDLRDHPPRRSRQPERGRRHEGAQPDPARLPGRRPERHSRVGGTGQPPRAAHSEVVVRAEEPVEAEVVGGPAPDVTPPRRARVHARPGEVRARPPGNRRLAPLALRRDLRPRERG